MKLDITGLNKAQLLVALYNNAKNSVWTQATIGNKLCPDEFVLSMLKDTFQPEIDAQIKGLNLTEKEADELLAYGDKIGYIGPVLIKMNLSGNEVDTTRYDKDHRCSDGGTPELAKNIIAQLRAGNTNLLWKYAGASSQPATTNTQKNSNNSNASSETKNKI